jgi:hypothetical protein
MNLLVAALDRAFPLEQVHARAVCIAEDLHLHVAGSLEKTFQHQAAVAERAFGLAAGAADRLVEPGCFAHDAHALAAAAGHCLHEQRVADARRLRGERRRRLVLAHVSRDDRHAGGRHQRLRFVFEAHRTDRGR